MLLPLSHRRGLDFMIVGTGSRDRAARSEEGGGQPALRHRRGRALQGRAAVPREDGDLVARLRPAAPSRRPPRADAQHAGAGLTAPAGREVLSRARGCALLRAVRRRRDHREPRSAPRSGSRPTGSAGLPPEGRQRCSRRCGCLPPWQRVAVPALGALLAGLILWLIRREPGGGHGVPDVMEVVVLGRKRAKRPDTCSCGRSPRSSGSSRGARSAARGR